MPTIRDVKNKFDSLIQHQQNLISAYDAEIVNVREDQAQQLGALKDWLADLTPALNFETLEILTEAARNGGEGLDFADMARRMQQGDAANRTEYHRLSGKHGAVAALRETSDERKVALQKTESELVDGKTNARKLDSMLDDVYRHNKKFPDAALTGENIDSYKKFDPVKFLFSPSWRSANKAATGYEPTTGSLAADLAARAELGTRIAVLGETVIPQEKKALEALGRDLGRMEELDAAYLGETGILDRVRSVIAEAMIRNEKFVFALTGDLGEAFVAPAALTALKARNLVKIEANLEAGREQAEKTLQSLEAPMSKINKGARNRPSKSVSVDLDKIETAVAGGRALGAYRVAGASSARRGVDSYTPASDASMFNFTNLMMLYLILDSGTDPAYAQGALGLGEAVAAEAGLDLAALAPDYQGVLGGLEDSGALAGALDGIDLSDLERSVGTLDLGSVDLGDVSRTIDSIPSYDLGGGSSSGGYDSYGGGGGYDGGGFSGGDSGGGF